MTSAARELADAMDNLIWLSKNLAATGVAAVIAERRHQIELGYTPVHDQQHHPDGWLATEATLEASAGAYMTRHDTVKTDNADQLARSAALLAAEIDRLR